MDRTDCLCYFFKTQKITLAPREDARLRSAERSPLLSRSAGALTRAKEGGAPALRVALQWFIALCGQAAIVKGLVKTVLKIPAEKTDFRNNNAPKR